MPGDFCVIINWPIDIVSDSIRLIKVIKLLYSNKFIRKARPKTHKVRLHLLLNKIFHTTVLLFPLNFFLIHASLKFSFECFRGYYKSSMGGVRVREETDEQLKLVKEPSLQSFGIVIGLYSSKNGFFLSVKWLPVFVI